MSWRREADFQEHLLNLLTTTRDDIVTNYKPFDQFDYSIDIRSFYHKIEEWRELKIIEYKGKGRSIQNLWKGIGKIEMMLDLMIELKPKNDQIEIYLSLPTEDFSKLHPLVQTLITKRVSLEIVSEDGFRRR